MRVDRNRYKTLGLFLGAFWTVNVPDGIAGAHCEAPKFLFCSISIGSLDEINIFRAKAGATPLVKTNSATRNVLSRDGCIRFHEYVENTGPKAVWNPTTNTYPWHVSMLDQAVPGISPQPVPAGEPNDTRDLMGRLKTCDALIVSGHHDAYNSSPHYPQNKDGRGNITGGYKLNRNHFIYGDDYSAHEASWPGTFLGNIETSPPAALPGNPPPRLLLTHLSRSAAVCNASYYGGKDYHSSTVGADSGKVLLSRLNAVFLFACNLSAITDPSNMTKDKVAINLPAPGTSFVPYTFQQRTQFLFGSALRLYTFPFTAPAGSVTRPRLNALLDSLQAPAIYGPDADFLTRYLEDLETFRRSGVTPTALEKITADGAKVVDELKIATASKVLAACYQKLNLSCNKIEVGASSNWNPSAVGAHMEECSVESVSNMKEKKRLYCEGLQRFYEVWRRSAGAGGAALRNKLKTVWPNGDSRRADNEEISEYDVQWLF